MNNFEPILDSTSPDAVYDPYSELKKYPQWILHRDKLPCNPHTGLVCDAHDPGVWMSWEQVQAAHAQFPGHGLAFVLQKNDPFFFLDIDKCLINDQWSPGALSTLAMVPGAMNEVSISGTGLHAIGRYSERVEHSCKNTGNAMEFYTEGRFVAIGNMATATGSSATVVDVRPLVDMYFPPSRELDMPWSTVPVAEWKGIEDDNQLIERMVKTQGSGVFGGKATIAQLWYNDEAALAKCYPAQNERDPYDRSSADAALAFHLAFHTGKNHQRIFELMWKSGLRREKWQSHKSYLAMTVSSAVNKCTAVYGAQQVELRTEPLPADLGGSPVVRERGITVIGLDQMKKVFEPFVYISRSHEVFDLRNGARYGPAQFKATMGGLRFMGEPTAKSVKEETNAFLAFTENTLYEFPKVWDLEFMPDKPPGTVIQKDKFLYLNSYIPRPPITRKGDVSIALNHIKRMLPHGDDALILLCWLATVARNPGRKLSWSPVLVGCEGNGKSWIGLLIEYVVGLSYTVRPNAREINSKFNGWLESALLAIVEEVNARGDGKVVDALKVLITSERMEIQAKGVDAKTSRNCANLLFMSNHLDGLPITADTRRLCVLGCNQMSREELDRDFPEHMYFNKLFNWTKREGGFEMFAHYLLHEFEVDPRYDPLGAAVTAPKTSTTDSAISDSLCPFAQRIQEAIDEDRPGFAGGFVYSIAVNRLFKETGQARDYQPRKLKPMMASLDYIPHPGLNGGSGRVNNRIREEGSSKGTLYIKEGSGLEMMRSAASEIERAFVAAQGYLNDNQDE